MSDPVLVEIYEIAHDADLTVEKNGRPESGGLAAIICGMPLVCPDDRTLTGYTDAVFDGLCAYLSREVL